VTFQRSQKPLASKDIVLRWTIFVTPISLISIRHTRERSNSPIPVIEPGGARAQAPS
jgi:hypothetical protein